MGIRHRKGHKDADVESNETMTEQEKGKSSYALCHRD